MTGDNEVGAAPSAPDAAPAVPTTQTPSSPTALLTARVPATPTAPSTPAGTDLTAAGFRTVVRSARPSDARAIASDDDRVAKYQEVDKLIAEDMPVIPLFYYKHQMVCSQRVKSLYMDPQKLCDMSTVELSA